MSLILGALSILLSIFTTATAKQSDSAKPPSFESTPLISYPLANFEKSVQKREMRERTPNTFEKLVKELGYEISPFGWELFNNSGSSFQPSSNIAVTEDYRLGPGDELNIRVWGAKELYTTDKVDRNGYISIPSVGPISVAGVPYKDLNSHLHRAISRYFRNFNVQATLGELKSIQIYLLGHVDEPGAYTVNSLSTLTNALLLTGGPSETGSLRSVELRRGGQLLKEFDLYDLLIKGDRESDITLAPGDVIFIPPRGSEIALVNGVRRTGIYELRDGETLIDAINMAGGYTLSTDTNLIRVERHNREHGLSVHTKPLNQKTQKLTLKDGDIISLNTLPANFTNAVTVRGHLLNPGRREWFEGKRVSDLFSSTDELQRHSHWENKNQKWRNNNSSSNARFEFDARRTSTINWDYAVIERFNRDSLTTEIIPFELRKAIFEKESSDNIVLQPGDIVTTYAESDVAVPIRRRTIYAWIDGEVNRPGVYAMRFGETLQDLIEQANGVTDEGYIFGTRFHRLSAQIIQQENYERVLQEMERQIHAQSTSHRGAAIEGQLEAQLEWLEYLRQQKPDGRIILNIPAKSVASDLPKIPLESGDHIHIPSKPSTVGIYGQVAQQSVFFYEGQRIRQILKQSGGRTIQGDRKGTFVVRANGSIVSEREYGFLFWQLRSMRAMPGDAVFVPSQVRDNQFMPMMKDWSAILGNFALTAAAIVTLSNSVNDSK